MKDEQKYYCLQQGAYDKDGKYHQFGGFKRHTIEEYIEWGLATEIDILDFFETKAKWGTGHYAFLKGEWVCGSFAFDSSG